MPARRSNAETFKAIRTWDGHQTRAFEELCFQLRDSTPEGAELVKTGDPDAGVEWYWAFSDGGEIGWQAKYLFETDSLLAQMRESLASAAKKRPGLRELTFCIPYDLADDPSRARGKQARERFEEARTQRWKEIAPNIEVKLLSGGQLLERLALERHRGREWFFFGERILGPEWCAAELKATADLAGRRYTPEQDIELPIDQILEGIAIPESIKAELDERHSDVLFAARKLLAHPERERPGSELMPAIAETLGEFETTPVVESEPPGVEREMVKALVEKALGQVEILEEHLWPLISESPRRHQDEANMTAAEAARHSKLRAVATEAAAVEHKTRDLGRALRALRRLLDGPGYRAAELSAIFIHGPAGRGKTHLFCDVGKRLHAEGHPVVVLLGERFNEGSPWKSLAALLGEPNMNPDEIAAVLAASGEASGKRAVLMIDAINETKPDPGIWASELTDMRRRLTATGWVGFAVSCRDTYLELVEPRGGPDDGFARVEHLGYRGREHEATEKIFALHNLALPRVPLLLPEFSNPLFLKLYCEGLEGQPSPLSGGEHLSGVFGRFIAVRGAMVERALQLDPGLETVQRALSAFAKVLVEEGGESMPYAEAAELINGFAPHLTESPQTLIEQMASEGLIAIDRVWIEKLDKAGQGVSFAYQRFSDHLIVGTFVNEQLDGAGVDDVRAVFQPGGRLEHWLRNARLGLLEAMAVELPERWGVELPDLYTGGDDEQEAWYRADFVLPYFLSSIVARNRDAFTSRSEELLTECLNSVPRETLDALVSVAPDPDHPYNGDRLHELLSGLPMAKRDAYWGIETFDSFGDPSQALDRLIRWAARGPYRSYDDRVVELACLPIIWLLGSPDRFGRDYATKALASVLIERIGLVESLITRFAEIDDSYLKQRLAAAALGSVARSNPSALEAGAAESLMETLITRLIENRTLPDVLSRDYVASLARWMRRHSLIPPLLMKRALPPYECEPPTKPRSTKELERLYPEGEGNQGYRSLIYSALSNHSDWSRYAVQGRVDEFLPIRLGDPMPHEKAVSRLEIDEEGWKTFVDSLEPEQLATLAVKPPDFDGLFTTLDANQSALFDAACELEPSESSAQTVAVPSEEAGRLIFERTIELGWTPELFADFDWAIARRRPGRDSHKAERFGKKYQWIALYELLARLSDNFKMRTWGGVQTYEGAWQLGFLRDIDPTLAPERIRIGEDQEQVRSPTFPVDRSPTWWSPPGPEFETQTPGQEGEWSNRQSDLPTVEELLRVQDPNGRRWLIIDGFRSWRLDPEEAASIRVADLPLRELSIRSLATVIRRSGLERLQAGLAKNPDLLRSVPDWSHHGIYGAFWAEIPGEAAIFDHPAGWRSADEGGDFPLASAPTTVGYSGEDGSYDCSLSNTINVQLPSEFLRSLAGARWLEADNLWIDGQGEPFAQFRENDEGFHRDSALMIDAERIRTLLAENDLALAIGLFSERRVFNNSQSLGDFKMLGWTDFAGHLILDGDEIHTQQLVPIKTHQEG